MGNPSTVNSDLYVAGFLTSKTFTAPAGSITDAAIVGAAGIQATKVVHQTPITHRIAGAVSTTTVILHKHLAASNISAVQVFAGTTPTSSDTVVVDVKRALSGSTSFTSILGSTLTLNSSSSALTPLSGTVSSPSSAAGDVLEVVVTATGTSCHDLVVHIWSQENPQ